MKLLTVKEVAAQAGVSEALVYSWVEDRLLAVYRLGGRGKRGKIMVDEADLVAFLQGCRVDAQKDTAPAPRKSSLKFIRY